MSQARYFTLEEATAKLPELRRLTEQQMARREVIEQELVQLSEVLGSPPENIAESPSDSDEVRALKRKLSGKIDEYQRVWNELEATGIVLKDARTGLFDFVSRIDGRTVYLCWRYGEDSIGFYHDLDVGFAGRKPLDGAVRARHYN